jgi:hypothetical protein
MKLMTFVAACAILFGATAASLAQSQPNCGANGPGIGDTFGKPPSGTLEGRIGADRCRAYLRHAHYHRHWNHYTSR